MPTGEGDIACTTLHTAPHSMSMRQMDIEVRALSRRRCQPTCKAWLAEQRLGRGIPANAPTSI